MGFLDLISKTIDNTLTENSKAMLTDDNDVVVADGTELYMKEKTVSLSDNYDIFDARERPVYKVKGSITGLGFKIKKEDGELVADIKKKLAAITPSYDVSFKNGQKAMFKMTVVDDLFKGTLNGKEIEIKRDYGSYNFEVYVDNQKIGAVTKQKTKLFSKYGDIYAISFTDESWKDFMAVFVVTVDNAYHTTSD